MPILTQFVMAVNGKQYILQRQQQTPVCHDQCPSSILWCAGEATLKKEGCWMHGAEVTDISSRKKNPEQTVSNRLPPLAHPSLQTEEHVQ